ncbi:MAG: M23 family metallopeptidase [Bacteroidota bacterium]
MNECDEFEFDCDTDNGGGGTGDDPVDEDCDPGQVKDINGSCVDKPCSTSLKSNPMNRLEVLQTKNNGVKGGLYGNGRGRFHDGIDLYAPVGTPVHAMFDSVVDFSINTHQQDEDWENKNNWNYDRNAAGNRIYIKSNINGNDVQFGYWHLTNVAINPSTGEIYKAGDQINQGDILGYVGTTGNANSKDSAGSHLHLRGRLNNKAFNPQNYFYSEIDSSTGLGTPCD